jgi:hypothetical protein
MPVGVSLYPWESSRWAKMSNMQKLLQRKEMAVVNRNE